MTELIPEGVSGKRIALQVAHFGSVLVAGIALWELCVRWFWPEDGPSALADWSTGWLLATVVVGLMIFVAAVRGWHKAGFVRMRKDWVGEVVVPLVFLLLLKWMM